MRKKQSSLVVIEDINFLDLPTSIIDEKGKRQKLIIERPNGTFTMASSMTLPTQFDKKVLYCLLTQIVSKGTIVKHEVTTTRYSLACTIYKRRVNDSEIFDRILLALKKYKSTTFHFEGLFYSNKNRTTRFFSYIDDVILDHETKDLYVRFNQQYIELIKESGFVKYIDFEVYNSLQLPVSARLYEILCKVLEYNSTWSIGLQNLAEKMTLQKRSGAKGYYPSDVLAKVKPGIDEISKKSPMQIEFVYSKENDVIAFKRIRSSRRLSMSSDLASGVYPEPGRRGGHRASPRKSKVTKVVPAKKTKLQKPKQEVELAVAKQNKKTVEECITYFKSLPAGEQELILKDIKRQPFLQYLADDNQRIFAYMTNNKQWPSTQL